MQKDDSTWPGSSLCSSISFPANQLQELYTPGVPQAPLKETINHGAPVTPRRPKSETLRFPSWSRSRPSSSRCSSRGD
ncbi:hypothetical protein IFM89_003928 [Coptis chinensis]|uniref:Uncharacterized protein n=1 Tax=Coptis chinensis TaxID=261450 RepID=A0A835HTY6_9MAGN|nr:hypothetical protein IFM89_003928 [Coptis chinensis]